MDTLQEKEAMQNLPFREDSSIDLIDLGRRQLDYSTFKMSCFDKD